MEAGLVARRLVMEMNVVLTGAGAVDMVEGQAAERDPRDWLDGCNKGRCAG